MQVSLKKRSVVGTHKDHVRNDCWVGLTDLEMSAFEVVTSFVIRGGQLVNIFSGV